MTPAASHASAVPTAAPAVSRSKQTDTTSGQSVWSKMWTPGAHWDDKEEFLDVIYWGRQVAAIVIGIVWGFLGLQGFFGIAAFIATNSFLVFVYSTYFNDETEEEMMEFVKEGFMTAFAAFMVSWIMTYSAVFHPDIFSSSILFPPSTQ